MNVDRTTAKVVERAGIDPTVRDLTHEEWHPVALGQIAQLTAHGDASGVRRAAPGSREDRRYIAVHRTIRVGVERDRPDVFLCLWVGQDRGCHL